ncbi:hypothetical protein [Enterococcus sp. AZ102]|uniref:hypothetical protein n=1 Tax=Enterococcus sp. AZ102 TaxID=2774865 RepID=UPI003F26974B
MNEIDLKNNSDAIDSAVRAFSKLQNSFCISLDQIAVKMRKINIAIILSSISNSENKEVKRLYNIYKRTKKKRIKNKQMKKMLVLMRGDI